MAHEQTVKNTRHYRNVDLIDSQPIVRSGATHALGHVVDIITALILLILSIRFMFEIFATDRASRFSQFVYGFSEPLVAPFAGLFPNMSLGVNGGKIEAATIVGMIAIAFISYAVQQLLHALQPTRTLDQEL